MEPPSTLVPPPPRPQRHQLKRVAAAAGALSADSIDRFTRPIVSAAGGEIVGRLRAETFVEGRSYFMYASFSDPDGNGWLLQQVTTRILGRE